MTDKTPRKNDPSYHVFKQAGSHPHTYDHLTHKGPVKAASRKSAIEIASGPPRELAEGEAPPMFLVVQASEFQTFSPRVKVERSVSWEPLPADPSALSVPVGVDGKERDQ